jgi:hypothetical protein
MTLIWLLVWLIARQPHLTVWNGWLIALVVCIALDAHGSGRQQFRHRERPCRAGAETLHRPAPEL